MGGRFESLSYRLPDTVETAARNIGDTQANPLGRPAIHLDGSEAAASGSLSTGA